MARQREDNPNIATRNIIYITSYQQIAVMKKKWQGLQDTRI